MNRLKVIILFGTKPNFEKEAFMYFILYVNKIQNTYEFCFPDVLSYPLKKGVIDGATCYEKVNDFVSNNALTADHFITIITNSFSDNFFFKADRRISIITTDIWDKHFSPPSLFEYLLHCIYTCLLYSQIVPKDITLTDEQLLINIGSHSDTRGCIADFTRQKHDDRIDIALGYICEEHTQEIRKYYGDKYFDDFKHVISRKWIGSIEEKECLSYNLKHIYKFNINRESGFNKSLWDKTKDKFYEIPGSLTGELLKLSLLPS